MFKNWKNRTRPNHNKRVWWIKVVFQPIKSDMDAVVQSQELDAIKILLIHFQPTDKQLSLSLNQVDRNNSKGAFKLSVFEAAADEFIKDNANSNSIWTTLKSS